MISLSKFSRTSACVTNTRHNSVALNSKANKHLDEAIIIKDVIKAYLSGDYRYGKLDELEADIAASYTEVDDISETQKSYEHTLAKQLNRYLKHEYRSKPIMPEEPIMLDLSEFVTTDFEDSDNIAVRVDAIFKTSGVLEGVLYKKGAPKLGASGRARRSVNNEIPLYLLLRAMRQYADSVLDEGESVNLIASYYYMKKTKDTSVSAMTEDYFGTDSPTRSLSETYRKPAYSKGEKYVETDVDKNFKELLDKWATGLEKTDLEEEKDCKSCQNYAVCYYKPAPAHYVEDEVETKKRAEYPLNPEQQAIVDFRKGIAQVNAGAGSGKTETAIKARTVAIVMEELESMISRYESGENIFIPKQNNYVTMDSRR